MGPGMEEQLFKNVSHPKLLVGDRGVTRRIMALSGLFHFIVGFILLAIASFVADKPVQVSDPVVAFFAPLNFYNPEPPPPPPKQSPVQSKSKENKPEAVKQVEQKKEEVVAEVPETISPAPVEAPSEIKPEPPDESGKNSSEETEENITIGGKSGVKNGVPGGISGGVPGKSRTFRRSSPTIEEPVRVGGNVRTPRRIKYVHPDYPPDALSAKIEGIVIIEATIGKDGRIVNAKVIKSVPALDSAALEAVGKWQYTPTMIDGKPREVILVVTLKFEIK